MSTMRACSRERVAPACDAERSWPWSLAAPARARLRRQRPEPEAAVRHHLSPERRGLPAFRGRDGRVEPQQPRVEHVRLAARVGGARCAVHGPLRQLPRQRDEGEPLGDADEGAGSQPSLPHARGSEARGLRLDRGLVPADEDPRRARLRQSRSVRGGREGRVRSGWVSTGRVEVQPLLSEADCVCRVRG